MNYRLDHPEKFAENFTDSGFDDFVEETANGEGDDEDTVQVPVPVSVKEVPKDDPWEDIPENEL